MSFGDPAARLSHPFTDERRFAWLRLWRSENVGPRTFAALLQRFGSAEAAIEGLPGLLRSPGAGRAIKLADIADIERELAAADRLGARFIARDEAGYPDLLRQIDSPPAVIAVRGRAELLDRPALAIVGARNASAAGLAFAERLARGLAQAGYVIVSGFARGIDARAHRASLATGTIAVLAGGHDRLYPADQGPFLDMILKDGAAISEMPFGWEARGRDFPRRNRLVSGLSLGLIVIEAARRSGSLITARFAADQGREVFAVPGSPLDPRAEGTNDLLRDGASFCCDVDDVLRALAERTATRPQDDLFAEQGHLRDEPLWDEFDLVDADAGAERPVYSVARADDRDNPLGESGVASGTILERVIEKLGPTPVSIDELGRCADLSPGQVRAALLDLDLAGRLERHGGGLVSLIPPGSG